MKLSPALIFKSATLAVLLGSFALSSVAQAAENDVLVSAVAGDVKYSSGGGAFVPVPVGTHLRRGDVIKTGPSSHADLEVGHNVGVVQITPETTFGVGELTVTETPADTVSTSEFDLSTGAIYARINKLAKASRYEIKTPKGIAGVRGTTIYLTANGDLTVGEGTAGIAYFGGNAFVLHDAQTVSPGDTAPRPASEILLKEIVDSVWDATHHGIGRDIRPFVQPSDFFVSPILPSK
ncbi:MAG TPA: FecR domain-containing protein [Candidatus Acidoferrum sp.]|nr:FecR domain-containing protein [Candidatus Acidoferrum sp.]